MNLAFLGANTMYWRIRLDRHAARPARICATTTTRNRTRWLRTHPARPPPAAVTPLFLAPENAARRHALRVLPRRHRLPRRHPRVVGLREHRRPARPPFRRASSAREADRVYPNLHRHDRCKSSAILRLLPWCDDLSPVAYYTSRRARGCSPPAPCAGSARWNSQPAATGSCRSADAQLRPAGHREPAAAVRRRSGGTTAPRPRQPRRLRPAPRQLGLGELSHRVGLMGNHGWHDASAGGTRRHAAPACHRPPRSPRRCCPRARATSRTRTQRPVGPDGAERPDGARCRLARRRRPRPTRRRRWATCSPTTSSKGSSATTRARTSWARSTRSPAGPRVSAAA